MGLLIFLFPYLTASPISLLDVSLCVSLSAPSLSPSFYLKRLEGEANMEILCYRDLPHAYFAGPVVVGIIGRLNLAIVAIYLSPTDGCGGEREGSTSSMNSLNNNMDFHVFPFI